MKKLSIATLCSLTLLATSVFAASTVPTCPNATTVSDLKNAPGGLYTQVSSLLQKLPVGTVPASFLQNLGNWKVMSMVGNNGDCTFTLQPTIPMTAPTMTGPTTAPTTPPAKVIVLCPLNDPTIPCTLQPPQ